MIRLNVFRFFVLTILATCFIGTVLGQSRLQNLIRTYKEQNPENLQRNPESSHQTRQEQTSPNQLLVASRQSVNSVQIPVPSGGTLPLGGDFRDPLSPSFTPLPNPATKYRLSPYDEMRSDARLNDVFFVDSQHGWAVGDRGVIWHTDDAGTNWVLQESPISCTLWSVYFLDASFGFAVGGYYYPFNLQGRGVVLITQDGGKNWSIRQTPDLPVLHRVKMIDPMKIMLAGESSEYHPTGLFLTQDSGRTWKTIFGGKTEGWTAADFIDETTGAGISTQGTIQIYQNETAISQTPSFGSARLANLKLVTEAAPPGNINGWMVGDGGLILSTLDRGRRWGVVPGKLPGNSATTMDLNTIESQGTNLWAAGNPGTIIYSSADLGKTWKATPSGVSTAIRKIIFADAKNGWAVGDLGTILNSDDGGASWKTQRVGGSRLAMLGIFGRAEDIPLEAYTSLCAHQGYLGGVLLLFQDEDQKILHSQSVWNDRVHEAVIRTGASGTWELGTFSLPRQELQTTLDHLVQQLQKENDGKGIQRIRERIVAAIRLWRPEILFTSDLGSRKNPVREFALREIMEAVKQADDPMIFPYQITELGLTTWKVKKVHIAQDDGVLGDVNLAATEPSIRLGQPIDEIAFTARGLLEMRQVPRPAVLGFTTPYDETPPEQSFASSAGSRDFFAGIAIMPGSENRRALNGSYAEQWDAIQLRIKQRRQILGMIRHTAKVAEENGCPLSDVRLASHASELTRKIDQDAAVQILLEMGQDYHRAGDWDSALEAFDIIAKQYTGHPAARQSFLWLLRYYAAEETGWRKYKDNIKTETQVNYAVDEKGRPVVNTSQTQGSSLNRHKLDPRLDKGLAVGRYLEQNFPDLADDATIRFALASAFRRRGLGQEALKYYNSRGNLKFDDVWGMRARAELWLAADDKSELPPEQKELPIPSIQCLFTRTKPFLDGKFDKQFDQGTWFNSKLYSFTPEKPRLRLQEMLKDKKTGGAGLRREEMTRAESKNFGTQMMFMYDKEYLYLGIRCKRIAEFSYPPIAQKPRTRDVRIDDQDRIEILLDVDRDYGTYYSLTVDSQGWIVDSCWGDRNWNPSWYVARHEDKDSWYIEAAIPLESLTDQFPMPKTIWAVAMRRIVPGVGIECWNAENSFHLTEGFGFLVFE